MNDEITMPPLPLGEGTVLGFLDCLPAGGRTINQLIGAIQIRPSLFDQLTRECTDENIVAKCQFFVLRHCWGRLPGSIANSF